MSNGLPPDSSAEACYHAGLAALEDWSTRQDALSLFQQAVELDPEHLDAWYELATQQRETGDYAEALVSCDRILSFDPDHSQTWACRAAARHDLQRFTEAIESYERALEGFADLPDVEVLDYSGLWSNRGSLLAHLGRPEDAIASYDEAIALLEAEDDPENDQTLGSYYGEKGNILFSLGRYEEAIDTYNQAFFLEATAQENRFKAHALLGREQELLDAYDQQLSEFSEGDNSPNPYGETPDWIWRRKGDVLMQSERYEEALAAYQKAFELNPDWHDLAVNDALGKLNYAQQDIFTLLLENYDRALENYPEKAQLWYKRALLLSTRSDRAEAALASFDRSLAVDPSDVGCWYNRALLLTNLQRLEEAVISYGRALAIDPDNDSCWHNQALLLEQLGRYEEALSSYDSLLDIDSRTKPPKAAPWVLDKKAELLRRLQRREENS
ncbi:tetratricopeptide repeat protein [Allocoleopsis franciscana]|uniref:Tetratricopeptide repeat protein n=1 Tax=Allocoleopsis franciscana PCC 7113 TaxID=1173027 RepID=K9WGD1_9CYAN|nr:tetratricopeptide repeat protein [Allocoleopsis franciscana]AFZ18871.1 tetratricopeptide repeat protein [Allocoleopsis franciscana PCC 7113]